MQNSVANFPALRWLPVPSDFQAELRINLNARDPRDSLEKLASLADHQLSFLETVQLDRAIDRLALKGAPGFQPIRLAVLASSTVDQLAPAIRVAGLRRKMLIGVHIGAYGQYRQEILDETSSFHQSAPQATLFSLSAREIIGAVPVTATVENVEETIANFINELRLLWQKVRERHNSTIIQQNFIDVTEPLFGSYDCFVRAAPASILAKLNDRLHDAATGDNVFLLDVSRASQRDGIDAWFDITRWFQGKLEIAPQAAALYGDLLVRILAAQRGLSKKCLVLDLDNTLWGGVIGDDGLEGIVLGEGSAVGEAHLALQRYAKQLKERGVILAVCSKNDTKIAEAAFDEHPEMLLRRKDISAFLANWGDKAENLKSIAQKLNIGIDSLVFVDDNPAERARIRESLPMVAVPELPDDPAHYVRCIAEAGYFEAIGFTPEDRDRSEQYAANNEREALLASSQSMEEFLQGLKMSVVYGPFTSVDHARVVQLINKTNQFNTTTRRYRSDEIMHLASLPGVLTLQFRLLDRIGDNGIVSAMILRPVADQGDVLEVENWVMSCRVFGRQLEYEAMNIAVEAARERGVKAFVADYIPSPKNGVISTLFPSLGFSLLKEAQTRWLLDLNSYVMRKNHIVRAGAIK